MRIVILSKNECIRTLVQLAIETQIPSDETLIRQCHDVLEMRSALFEFDTQLIIVHLDFKSEIDWTSLQVLEGRTPLIAVLSDNCSEEQRLDAHRSATDVLCEAELSVSVIGRSVKHALLEQESLRQVNRLHAKVKKSAGRLADATKSNHSFVQEFAHRFRTPLTVINEYANLMRDGMAGQTNDKQNEFLETIVNRVGELNGMFDDMLDVHRLQSNMMTTLRARTSITLITAQIVDQNQIRAANKGIDFQLEIEEDLPTIYCDQNQIRRAFSNLLANAIVITPEGGLIRVFARFERDTSQVVLGVENSESESLKPELDQFVDELDVEVDWIEPGNGLGLGLDLVRPLVEVNLGSLYASCFPESMTAFTIQIPIDDPSILIHRFLDFARSWSSGDIHYRLLSLRVEDSGLANFRRDAFANFLQSQVDCFDFIYPVGEHGWSILTTTESGDANDLLNRIHTDWDDMVARGAVPAGVDLLTRSHGPWSLSSERSSIFSEFLAAICEEVEQDELLKRVLVVDDDPEIVDALTCRLEALGYEVLTAPNGREGVDAAFESSPDAIILDVRMPELDGLSALSELKAHDGTKNTPVIMLSASLRDQQKALDDGARFFVQKPYDAQTVVSALETSLECDD